MKEENTIGLIGMVFSIAGLVLLITLVGAPLWILLLVIWLILWTIWLFSKPRWKAIVAVVIPVILGIAITCLISTLWKSVKVPATQFGERAQQRLDEQEISEEDEDLFENIVNSEFEKLLNSKTEEEWKNLFEASEGSNVIEKGSYLFFDLLKEWMNNSLDQYNLQKGTEVQALPETENVSEEGSSTGENTAEENIAEGPSSEESSTEEASASQDQWTVETFNESELSDIEQVINILE